MADVIKTIMPNDVVVTHNGKQILVGLREWEEDEINMVIGEVIDATTYKQVDSSGYSREHIVSSEQFCKEVFVGFCNKNIVKHYGPFPNSPLTWWEVHAAWFQSHYLFDPVSGFSLRS